MLPQGLVRPARPASGPESRISDGELRRQLAKTGDNRDGSWVAVQYKRTYSIRGHLSAQDQGS